MRWVLLWASWNLAFATDTGGAPTDVTDAPEATDTDAPEATDAPTDEAAPAPAASSLIGEIGGFGCAHLDSGAIAVVTAALALSTRRRRAP